LYFCSESQIITFQFFNEEGEFMNIIAFGAHPDDCEYYAGGTAVKFKENGHRVKFVSVNNGDAGHQSMGGGILASVRRAEVAKADKMSTGITGL
jgi:LmbE family N-acetylglucosaminyl deacetylase